MKNLLKENLIICYAIIIFWLPTRIMTGFMEMTFFYKVGFPVASATLLFLSLVALILAYLWFKDKSNRFVLINTPLVLSFLLGVLGILFSIIISDPENAWRANMTGVILSVSFFIIQLLVWLVLFYFSKSKKIIKHFN